MCITAEYNDIEMNVSADTPMDSKMLAGNPPHGRYEGNGGKRPKGCRARGRGRRGRNAVGDHSLPLDDAIDLQIRSLSKNGGHWVAPRADQ